MSLNYVDERFVKIECDKVCADNCDIKNLLRPNNQKYNDKWISESPFLVESFISPPVSVKINFTLHPIDVYGIDIGLQVRCHRSSSIIVSTSTSTPERSEEIFKMFNIRENRLIILNNNYRQNYALGLNGFSSDSLEAEASNNAVRGYRIARRFARSLMNVKYVTIRIVATNNRSVPCLR